MFRRTAPARSSSTTVAAHRRRSGRTQIGWSETEAADMIAAPGMAVSAGARSAPRTGGAVVATGTAPGATVTAADRRAENDAVSIRLDRAWRRLEAARAATEGRPGGIGDDTARRDPVTQPFPIAFGTPARAPRSATRTGAGTTALPTAPAAAPPAVPAVAATPRPVRRTQAAISLHRPQGTVARTRAPRRLTADRWSTALG